MTWTLRRTPRGSKVCQSRPCEDLAASLKEEPGPRARLLFFFWLIQVVENFGGVQLGVGRWTPACLPSGPQGHGQRPGFWPTQAQLGAGLSKVPQARPWAGLAAGLREWLESGMRSLGPAARALT